MAPGLSIFGDFTKDAEAMYNNFRVYGSGLLVVMGKSVFCLLNLLIHSNFYITGLIVFLGVKFVNRFATVALACVIFSIIAVYIGIFDNLNGNEKL